MWWLILLLVPITYLVYKQITCKNCNTPIPINTVDLPVYTFPACNSFNNFCGTWPHGFRPPIYRDRIIRDHRLPHIPPRRRW